SEALNSIYEQATGETSALFRQTSEKFIEIVRQMKEMSAAMQREMETTRTELRRGILELPQETAESAANMRRVIVEQIDALAELNRIVARHSRDTVEPARRAEPVAAAGGAARADARPRFEEAREARPSRFEEARPARPEPAGAGRPGPARRPAEPAAPEGRGGGWLTDLLGRASSREEPAQPAGDERQTRRAMESLDSLSVDIARMIDHD